MQLLGLSIVQMLNEVHSSLAEGLPLGIEKDEDKVTVLRKPLKCSFNVKFIVKVSIC